MSILSKSLGPSPKVSTPEPLKPSAHASRVLSYVISFCLHALVVLLPVLFTTWTIDTLEMVKQTTLVVLVSVAFIAWIGKALAEKSFTLIRHWVHLVVLLFGVGYLIVSFFSVDRYQSFVGAFGQMPWSFTTVLALIILYFVVVHHVRKTSQVYNFILSFLIGSFIAAFYGFLQLVGWFVFQSPITQNRAFTTVGSVFSLSVFLVVPIIICASLIFHGCRNKVCHLGSKSPLGVASRILLWAVLVLGLVDLILVDYWGAWLGLIFGVLLTVGIGLLRSKKFHSAKTLLVPIILLVVGVLFLIVQNPIKLPIPGEVSPSFKASWAIAQKTLEQSPLVGSGPGTWIYDYARYRMQEINNSPFWQVRFDRAFSYVLTLIATTGLVGVVLWVMLVVSGVVKSVNSLVRERDEDIWFAYLTVFSGWLTLIFLSFFYNLNMPHMFALWFLFGLLGAIVSRNTITWEASKQPYAYGLLSTAFIVLVVAGVSVSWLAGQRYAAEAFFSEAVGLHRSGADIDQVLPPIKRATSLNSLADVYARNLSQAYLLEAVSLIQKDPSQGDAIQQALKASVDEGVRATELGPHNIDNWTNLGLIYENVASFTRGADELAIANFSKASELEPQNPVILTEIGKLYLLRSDTYRANLGQAGQDQTEVQNNVDANLKQAEQYLRLAVGAKPDYLPSRYYLGIVFERNGNIQSAITELENVLLLNNKDVGVAFELSILYYRNNQKSESLNLMEQVAKLAPDNVNAKWYLSAMYEEAGRLDDAIAVLEDLHTQFPDNTAVSQRLDTVKKEQEATRTPSAGELPSPIEHDISGPQENNPIQ